MASLFDDINAPRAAALVGSAAHKGDHVRTIIARGQHAVHAASSPIAPTRPLPLDGDAGGGADTLDVMLADLRAAFERNVADDETRDGWVTWPYADDDDEWVRVRISDL